MLCHNLVKTGVFEQMADQSRTVDEISETGRLHRDTLYRALRMTTVLDELVVDGRDRAGDSH